MGARTFRDTRSTCWSSTAKTFGQCRSKLKNTRSPRKIAATRRTPQNCPRMIPLRSLFDSLTFAPGRPCNRQQSNFRGAHKLAQLVHHAGAGLHLAEQGENRARVPCMPKEEDERALLVGRFQSSNHMRRSIWLFHGIGRLVHSAWASKLWVNRAKIMIRFLPAVVIAVVPF
jgi:hypothetical protein